LSLGSRLCQLRRFFQTPEAPLAELRRKDPIGDRYKIFPSFFLGYDILRDRG
jgi:hypothetical protein